MERLWFRLSVNKHVVFGVTEKSLGIKPDHNLSLTLTKYDWRKRLNNGVVTELHGDIVLQIYAVSDW